MLSTSLCPQMDKVPNTSSYSNLCIISKDAGFVHESFQIEMNRVILKNQSSETNLRNKSLRFGLANPDTSQPGFVRIQDSQNLDF